MTDDEPSLRERANDLAEELANELDEPAEQTVEDEDALTSE